MDTIPSPPPTTTAALVAAGSRVAGGGGYWYISRVEEGNKQEIVFKCYLSSKNSPTTFSFGWNTTESRKPAAFSLSPANNRFCRLRRYCDGGSRRWRTPAAAVVRDDQATAVSSRVGAPIAQEEEWRRRSSFLVPSPAAATHTYIPDLFCKNSYFDTNYPRIQGMTLQVSNLTISVPQNYFPLN